MGADPPPQLAILVMRGPPRPPTVAPVMSAAGGRSRRELGSGLRIVNPDTRYARVGLIEPNGLGYVHIAAEVSPPRRRREGLLARLKERGRGLEQPDPVARVTVFDGVAIAPPSTHARRRPPAEPDSTARADVRAPVACRRWNPAPVAPFDVVVLVVTPSLDATPEVQHRPGYRPVIECLDAESSTLLVPAAGEHSYHVAIEHARRDHGLPRLLLQQLPKRTSRTGLRSAAYVRSRVLAAAVRGPRVPGWTS